MKIYISGAFFDRDEAKISVFDHGLLYGDGVFEGIRVYGGRVFKLREHVQRIFESAKSIRLEIPLTPQQFEQAIIDTVRVNEIIDGYVRPIVTRGEGSLGLDPRSCKRPEVIIIADTISLYPPEYYEKGLDIITVATIRNHPNALNPRIKSLNYLNNVMARMEASLAGCQEALMLNHLGEVAECSGDNVFIVKNDVIKTTPVNSGILEGITRNTVMELARDQNFSVVETPLSRHDIYTADEMFLTGTAAEVVAVVKCDGRVIGDGKPGPIFRRLRQSYLELTQGKYRWSRLHEKDYIHTEWNGA
jgi:branched-chain amino acid aminotransferase